MYFHGGGFCIGSISIMDNVARELAHACQATVISVEYRLAPEDPFPAGPDDCETVTRWALANTNASASIRRKVMVAGESAGGNFAALVALRLRDERRQCPLAGQVLIYPGRRRRRRSVAVTQRTSADSAMSVEDLDWCWAAYVGDHDVSERAR